ncbi:L,D-transpeptidase family protein [Methylacidiphilum caldifontis]|uniref:L,D-transpeptidase family protein n=1 Tax=Methylacidiphilum caldifontis TaxID=2795386 RepID=UPI001A8FF7DB|nr:L,D-transpeptidase family protein [Methylacidiphilum caldifontis]QSR89403.1 L,D-transpeptidase family protein [Methylacidiphilum caldifontis]
MIFFLIFAFHENHWGIERIQRASQWFNHSKDLLSVAEIIISLAEQKIYVYGTNGKLIALSIISSGRDKHATPPGEYQVIEKEMIHYSNLYGYIIDRKNNIIRPASAKEKIPHNYHFKGAPMPYFLRLTKNGIGLHGGLTTGRPLSHGCIRLPMDFAAKLYSITPLHTRILIFD